LPSLGGAIRLAPTKLTEDATFASSLIEGTFEGVCEADRPTTVELTAKRPVYGAPLAEDATAILIDNVSSKGPAERRRRVRRAAGPAMGTWI
jgi:hypothetical protein